jgi:hypothetical protein
VDPAKAKASPVKDLTNAVDPQGRKIRPPSIVDGFAYAGKNRSATGMVAISSSVRIAQPALDTVDYHSLAEKTAQNGRNIIEVGWVVNRQNIFGGTVASNLEPHFFASAWYDNGTASTWCGSYVGGCGYVDYAGNAFNVGASILSDKDLEKQIQIVYSAGWWWLSYNGGWVGSFPAALGHSVAGFTTANFAQDFGEIAYAHYGTCSDMGNGQTGVPLNPYPSRGATFTNLNVSTGSGYSLQPYTGNTVITDNTKWNEADWGSYGFAYGGTGYAAGSCP